MKKSALLLCGLLTATGTAWSAGLVDGVTESTDPAAVAAVEQHAEALRSSGASTGSAESAAATSTTKGKSSTAHRRAKAAHGKSGHSRQRTQPQAPANGSGTATGGGST